MAARIEPAYASQHSDRGAQHLSRTERVPRPPPSAWTYNEYSRCGLANSPFSGGAGPMRSKGHDSMRTRENINQLPPGCVCTGELLTPAGRLIC